MQIIVVGGSASKVGKTTLACYLITRARQRGRVVALKVSTHSRRVSREFANSVYAPPGSLRHDTDRYLAAGADAALLFEAGSEAFRSHLAIGLRRARELRPQTLVIESTTAGALLAVEHDSWFVAATAPWKPHAQHHFARARHIVRPHEVTDIALLLEPFEAQTTAYRTPVSGSSPSLAK